MMSKASSSTESGRLNRQVGDYYFYKDDAKPFENT